MHDLQEQGTRLISWCKEQALPFWANNGVDPKGGFYEDLAMDGSPNVNAVRRVRVQARQCYVYAHAADLGWFPGAHTVANHGWNYLTSKGLQGGEYIANKTFTGCAHLLNSDGSIHDASRHTYAQAFLLLASSWRFRAFNDSEGLECLNNTTDFLNTHLKANNEGWIEGIPNSLPRRQNPHMHLFEAFLAAYESTSDAQYLQLADTIFTLFTDKFFDISTNTLIEYFDTQWNPDQAIGHLTEPGHMMEWCWLIYWYARISKKDVTHFAEKLYHTGTTLGTNSHTKLIINEINIAGESTNSASRLWPQTEYVKANIARARAGKQGAEVLAANMINQIFRYYLDLPVKGGWYDQRDEFGELTSDTMPSSTFYHIFCMTAEIDQYFKQK
ncbi:MAG: AGE family epimerase/isomerase [Robiginitomaculum sp.]